MKHNWNQELGYEVGWHKVKRDIILT